MATEHKRSAANTLAYFPDLSPYEYYPGQSHMLNVGWLAGGQPFTRGVVPKAFAHELRLIASDPVEKTRGCHVCEFCDPPEEIIAVDPRYREIWEMFRCGNGELHVRGETGIVYCAPALVIHYVAEHQYQPPSEFVTAVLSQRSQRLLQRNAEQGAAPDRGGD